MMYKRQKIRHNVFEGIRFYAQHFFASIRNKIQGIGYKTQGISNLASAMSHVIGLKMRHWRGHNTQF